MPSALILIADGTEEMEFTITYDTLVRAGVTCQSAFVHDDEFVSPVAAKGSRGIRIMPDVYFEPDASGPDKFDALIIPGGAKGAETISKNTSVQALVRDYLSKEKLVGMICAGSMAALTSGLPKQPLTSHPSVKTQLESEFLYSEDPVVVSGNLITRYYIPFRFQAGGTTVRNRKAEGSPWFNGVPIGNSLVTGMQYIGVLYGT